MTHLDYDGRQWVLLSDYDALRSRLAAAEALLRGIRGWLGPSVTTWPQRIDAFLKETP